jgi:hypothetical protein
MLNEMNKIILCVAFVLGACATSNTQPVAVIGADGIVMRGSATASLQGSSFRVDGGGRTCSGSYDGLNNSITISMPVQCSDGKRGIVIVTRDPCGCSGSGRIRMQDGSESDFIFGKAAEAF